MLRFGGIVGRYVHVRVAVFLQVVTRLGGIGQRRGVQSALEDFNGTGVVVRPQVAILHNGHGEAGVESFVGIAGAQVDGLGCMAAAKGLAAVLILVGIDQRLSGTHARLAVFHAYGIVVLLPAAQCALLLGKYHLGAVAVVGAPDAGILAQLDAPAVGSHQQVVSGTGSVEPPVFPASSVKQRRCLVEQRASLQCQAHRLGGTADVGVQLGGVGDGQIFGNAVHLGHNPVHHLHGRCAAQAVSLVVG